MSPLIAIVLLFAPAAAAGADTDAESIAIDFSRPLRAGQVFSYAAVGRSYRETVVSTEGAVVDQSVTGTRCELAAALAVDSVRGDGLPHELSLRVFRLVVREGFLPAEEGGAVDAGEQPLESGTEIKVAYPDGGAGEPQLTFADGAPLDAALAAALRLALPGPAGTSDDDALFGREEPARLGERWEVAVPAVVSALAEGGIEVPEGKLSGEAALVRHDADAGAHVVEVVLTGERAGVPLPKGYVTRAGTLKVKLGRELPDDPAAAPRRDSAEYSLHSQAMGREGERLMVVDLAFFNARTAHFSEVHATALKPTEAAPAVE